MYDIAIIGTGPAGLSAAITARLRGKSVILLGPKALSGKLEKAHLIRNYLGLPEISGGDLAASFKNHLEKMQVEITEEMVRMVYAMGGRFELDLSDGKTRVEAKAVILATGVSQNASVKGEQKFLGHGASYCATCDGFFFKEKRVAVSADSPEYEGEVQYLSEIAEKVLFFPKYGAKNVKRAFSENVQILDYAITELLGESALASVKALNGRNESCEHEVDGVFFLRDCLAASSLVPGLETDGKHVKVDLQMRTNLRGLFACGDVAGTPYQYIKSAGQGNIAAISAAEYLANL